jgi:hypothetical protein
MSYPLDHACTLGPNLDKWCIVLAPSVHGLAIRCFFGEGIEPIPQLAYVKGMSSVCS